MVEYKYPSWIIKPHAQYTWFHTICMLPIYHDLSRYDLRGIDISRNYKQIRVFEK